MNPLCDSAGREAIVRYLQISVRPRTNDGYSRPESRLIISEAALVLSRKLGQSLIIGDTLEVALVRTAGAQGVVLVSIHSQGAKRRKHTARLRDSVKVDEGMRVEPLEITGREARLAIHAPKHVSVWRREVEKISQQRS